MHTTRGAISYFFLSFGIIWYNFHFLYCTNTPSPYFIFFLFPQYIFFNTQKKNLDFLLKFFVFPLSHQRLYSQSLSSFTLFFFFFSLPKKPTRFFFSSPNFLFQVSCYNLFLISSAFLYNLNRFRYKLICAFFIY